MSSDINDELIDSKSSSDNDEINILKNIRYHQLKKDSVWENRNVYCDKIIKKMRTSGIPSIEESGKYAGLPSLYETKLILNLCSNLSKDQLSEISSKIN